MDNWVTKDLGTYHVLVELVDGRGWIQQWDTGMRYCNGSGDCHPLTERYKPIAPTYINEDDLIRNILFMFIDDNYSCDCNKRDFLADAEQKDRAIDAACGDTLVIKRIILIRPDGSEKELYYKEGCVNE